MSSALFIRPGMWRVLINCTDALQTVELHEHMLRGMRKVNAYEEQGVVIALVWECESEVLALAQANELWSALIPARVTSTPGEEFEFLQHLLAASRDLNR